MTEHKELLSSMHGFSPDTAKPLTIKRIPANLTPSTDGFITLFGEEQQEPPDQIFSISDIGTTRCYENPAQPDKPYLFTDEGYELTYNQGTGEYTYVIHPQYDVDFEELDSFNDNDRLLQLNFMQIMSPTITIKNNLTADTNLTLSLALGRNRTEIFSLSDRRKCTTPQARISTYYQEEYDRVKVVSTHAKAITKASPHGPIYSNVSMTADLAYPKEATKMLIDSYAKYSPTQIPTIKEIMCLANATLHITETDPFSNFRV